MEEADEEWENKQRLKAALHYTVGNVCSQVEECTFSRELVAIITEATFKQAELLATDLELFAKHAKRTTISADDVKLCCRRSQSLLDIITARGEKIRAEKDGGGGGGSTGKEGEAEGGVVPAKDKKSKGRTSRNKT